MRQSPRDGAGPAGSGDPPLTDAPTRRGTWGHYLRPFRFEHWIKNLVVPVGSVLALATQRAIPGWSHAGAIVLGFCFSGLVSSVNYALNEILDAPFDAQHPTKHTRPIPSGRVRVGPLLGLTVVIGLATFGGAWWLFPRSFVVATGVPFVAGLIYNLPPLRFKDWPYLDVVTEALTNPIRIAIGWYAVAPDSTPPVLLLAATWAFGAFLMAGKRLAKLRLLGGVAIRYRPTLEPTRCALSSPPNSGTR